MVARAERYAMYHGKRTFLSELANTPSYSSLSSKTQPAGYRQQLMFCGMSKLARRFNFIGRYENFATDVTKLMASVGVKLSRVVSEEEGEGWFDALVLACLPFHRSPTSSHRTFFHSTSSTSTPPHLLLNSPNRSPFLQSPRLMLLLSPRTTLKLRAAESVQRIGRICGCDDLHVASMVRTVRLRRLRLWMVTGRSGTTRAAQWRDRCRTRAYE